MLVFWKAAPLYYVAVLVWMGVVDASFWASSEEEARDEVHDSEILKAVFTSMEDYWLRKFTSGHRKKRANSVVCYGEIGCFEDTGPFGYIDMLPSSPEEVSTRFLLYSGQSRSDFPLLDVSFANMSQVWTWARKAFNTTAPTKIIVHGFGSSCSHVWVYEMRSALLSVEEANVICVDWESGAIIPNYVRAAANTRLVGKQLAMLIRGLTHNVGLTLEKVHLIGFSLGAHVAGFAGAELKNISRITGLDPAGPLFESQDPRARLDSSDAMFVDVIHSNGENLILGGLGSWQPMGHVDFYPNGGRMQKGCSNLFVGAVSDIIWSASDIEGRSLCNHRRAYKFFTDSVSPRCHFPAFPCESYEKFLEGKCFPCSTKYQCGTMGYYADRSAARGTLYLITRDEEPFCAHQYHVSVESSPSKLPVVSYGKIQITLQGDNGINETFTLTKKDDEELGQGTTLSKIVVPHPALLTPNSMEIVYTAYSGWISSGLKKWSLDKIKISDSFGKSVSVCNKDLILESNVPVMLKLFPGECNLPKEKPSEETTTAEVDPFFITESTKPDNTSHARNESSTTEEVRMWTGNKTVDGFPAYDIDKAFYSVFGSNTLRVSNESNENETGVIIDAIIPKLSIQSYGANRSDSNYTMKIIRRNEIAEPVLQPKSISRDFKEEIKEPVLKPIEKVEVIERISEVVAEETATKSMVRPRGINLGTYGARENRINYTESKQSSEWVPAVQLYPPPLGGKQLWDTTREPKTVNYKNSEGVVPLPPPSPNKDLPPFVTTLQNQMLRHDRNGSEDSSELRKWNNSRSLFLTEHKTVAPHSPTYSNFPKNKDGSITVQLFPEHLSSILKQAEQYAKMSLFAPLDIFQRPKSKASKPEKAHRNRTSSHEKRNLALKNNTKVVEKRRGDAVATPRYLEPAKPKHFLPRIYEYFEKGLENVRYLFGIGSQDKAESGSVGNAKLTDNMTNLIPYYYGDDEENDTVKKNEETIDSGERSNRFIPWIG